MNGSHAAGIQLPLRLPPEPPPTPPPPREHETLIQYNLRNKVCAYCKRPGAVLKCEGCRQRSYCDRKCQKRDWKQEHRGQCVKLQQVFVPPPPGWGGAAAAEVAAAPGGGGCAAAAAGGGGAPTVVIDEEDEIKNPCPICLENEDDAAVNGSLLGMCSACGQCYCGACNAGGLADRSPNCPTCRAPINVSDEKSFTRCWKLVHDRSPGRHTPAAQSSLGRMYFNGEGVEQDYVEAAKWYRVSAEAGFALAQSSLGGMYGIGIGVEQDSSKALKWVQLAAAQGSTDALKLLDDLQQGNFIPTPPPGSAVTTILLTSANAAKYNNRTGRVVAPIEVAAIKAGRAAVLLDGEAAPISFKLKNLQIHP
eukprot:gene22703-biopygen29461